MDGQCPFRKSMSFKNPVINSIYKHHFFSLCGSKANNLMLALTGVCEIGNGLNYYRFFCCYHFVH